VAEHHDVVAGYGLDTTLPAGVDHDELIALMRRDKKATSGLSFVLDGPGGVELVTDVPEVAVRTALAGM
jgi:5-deoxy-5-amino-3-dehydroquinate synthase